MAAANKPTAVHFSLVFFVMASLILGVVWYLAWKDSQQLRADVAQRDADLSELRNSFDNRVAEITALKGLLGYDFDQLGGSADDANTVMGALAADIQLFGGQQFAANTLKATLQGMRTGYDNLLAENQTLKDSLNQNQAQLVAVETGANNRVDQFQTSQESSETQLQTQITKHEQEISEKNGEIEQWKKDYNLVQSEKEQLRDEYERFRRDSDQRLALLNDQIDHLNDQMQELQKVSFEVPDGRIVAVDNTTRTVWIDLGSIDKLRPQVTFSVYTTDHRGIGRGVEDIKAKIEVTRIMDGHLSEARILDEDLFRPIAEGDPIFTPLWSAGRTEYFAIVGRPDLDEDGDSDWELFREVVENAGAAVDLIVNDEGLREPFDAKLSARTKFLIIGDMDDPAEFSGQPDKQTLATQILDEQKALIDEARLYGIRVVRLNDFLEYIGWKPQQRLWQPGENKEYNLGAGSQSTSVDEVYQDRTSSGQTSELFRQNRAGVQKEADGTTSGLFRSGGNP
jgi:hypothetical protein